MKRLSSTIFLVSALAHLSGCESEENDAANQNAVTNLTTTSVVSAVNFSGEPGNYLFSVTIESPDLGCNQYADWWEVVGADGSLIYRRILAHSHVIEQPFTRSGGPVNIIADDQVIVRSHMNNLGFGEAVFRGSVTNGFFSATLDTDFANDLELAAPLPDGCDF